EARTRNARSRSPNQRDRARSASSSTAWRPREISREVAVRRASSASPSECAGSVDTASTCRFAAATATACAAAHVVFPTPPLPAKKEKAARRGSPPDRCALILAVDRRLDSGDLHLAGTGRLAQLTFADLPQAAEEVRFDRAELLLADLAQFEPHLRGKQLVAQMRIVVQLGIGRRGELAEHELDATDEHAVEDDHFPSFARSSLRRMLTKLYGGHGPVYLKVSLSYFAPICLTR